jgi:glycosyltransferase involved in cell wall biosynthesis
MFMSEKSRGGAGSKPALLHGTTSTDRSRIAVVIPALNEESSIGLVVQAIPRPLVAEIIVVNNGSIDRTETVARDLGAMVLFESRKGYGYACLAGILHAVNNGAEIIVFLDGDFSDYPEELPKLVRPIIEQGYDMVVGSRMTGSRERGRCCRKPCSATGLPARLSGFFGVTGLPISGRFGQSGSMPYRRWRCPTQPSVGLSKCRSKPPSSN